MTGAEFVDRDLNWPCKTCLTQKSQHLTFLSVKQLWSLITGSQSGKENPFICYGSTWFSEFPVDYWSDRQCSLSDLYQPSLAWHHITENWLPTEESYWITWVSLCPTVSHSRMHFSGRESWVSVCLLWNCSFLTQPGFSRAGCSNFISMYWLLLWPS